VAVVRRGSSDEQDFLRRLRRARTEARLTQVEVARRLGRSQSFVTKAETGERRLDVVELRAFARIYGKRASYFLGD
jgi:transcriptional regulator with XRE-family HTH domain